MSHTILPDSKFQLNETQRDALVQAIAVAADQYKRDSLVQLNSGATRIANQFAFQAGELEYLAERIERADQVVIGQIA